MLQSVLGPSATQSIKQDAADETAGQVECLDGSFQYRLIWRPHVAEGPSQSGCLVVGFITDIKVPYPMFWMNVLPASISSKSFPQVSRGLPRMELGDNGRAE